MEADILSILLLQVQYFDVKFGYSAEANYISFLPRNTLKGKFELESSIQHESGIGLDGMLLVEPI